MAGVITVQEEGLAVEVAIVVKEESGRSLDARIPS